MTDPSPVEFLGDPLSEITRKERRNLLIASVIGVLVANAGLVPKKISTFGIELTVPAQETFIVVTALSVLYFVGAFVIYGLADFLVWRKGYQDYLEGVARLMNNWSMEEQHAYDELHENVPDISWLYKLSGPSALIRITFEYAIPILFGFFAIFALLFQLWKN